MVATFDYHDTAAEHFVARLTEAAYRVALRYEERA